VIVVVPVGKRLASGAASLRVPFKPTPGQLSEVVVPRLMEAPHTPASVERVMLAVAIVGGVLSTTVIVWVPETLFPLGSVAV
jgi:hypothetical protein